MDSGIRPRTERKAIYRSRSEGYANDSETMTSAPIVPTSPCQGKVGSLVDIQEQSSANANENLNGDIIQEISKNIVKPLMDKLEEILSEMQAIRHEVDRFKSWKDSLHKTVRAECASSGNACGESEPHGLMAEVMEEDTVYQDASKIARGKSKTHSIDNQLYGYIGYIGRDTKVTEHRNDDNGKTLTQQSGQGKTDMEKTKPKEFRSNSLQTRPKTKTGIVEPRPRSAIYANKVVYDDRECLANAIQFHVGEVVDGIVFHDSELPDSLIREECLTEDECSAVRKLRDRKDQIRVLLSLIKGRDLRVLKGFLKHIGQQNEAVAHKIKETYERNKREGVKGKLCALCSLEKQFNVKHVADSLWAIQAIDDDIYSRIIHSDSPVGAQGAFWKRVVQSLNGMDQQNAELAHNKLKHALLKNNLFTHLADGVTDMLIKNHGRLICSCEPRLILPRRASSFGGMTSAESFLPDSSSDGASNDLSSMDGTENGEMLEKDHNDRMSLIAEVNETPLSPSSVCSNATITACSCQVDEHSSTTVRSTNKTATSTENSTVDETQRDNLSPPKKSFLPNNPPVSFGKPEVKPIMVSPLQQQKQQQQLQQQHCQYHHYHHQQQQQQQEEQQQQQQQEDLKSLGAERLNNIKADVSSTHPNSDEMTKHFISVEVGDIPPLPEKKNNKQAKSSPD